MKVRELIEELKKHDGELIVYLEDWNEAYVCPAELATVKTEESCHTIGPADGVLKSDDIFVCLSA